MKNLFVDILKKRRHLLWLIIPCILAIGPSASALTIRAKAFPDSLTVGDRFLYVNTVELPPGAEIRLDGVLIGTATGGPMKKTLRAGPHEISVSLAGYRTFTRTVDIAEEDSFRIPRIELKKE